VATNWKVVNQVPRQELLQSGQFESGWDVFYETIPEGIRGDIWVPKRHYTAEYVAQQIDQEVNALKNIASL
jgi:hypothetical protein